MKVAVCGGAGYIGSHAVLELLKKGHEVIVLDNLENGHAKAVSPEAQLYVGDIRDAEYLDKVFGASPVDAVMDFAAYSLVGESVTKPAKYYKNNVYGTMCLVEGMMRHQIHQLVFSSTAAVYGVPENIPIMETDVTAPANPYGETKLAVERMLRWFADAYGLQYAALRYFNVAGADASGEIGECHNPETHIIPNILKAAMEESRQFSIFGGDYDTPDGTCIRDYIHVTDLAQAHILALNALMNTGKSLTYNLGNGKGFSNKEILEAAIKVTGKSIPYTIESRRAGDPPVLVASSDKIMAELKWSPAYASLEKIIETAWRWHKNHPGGY